MKINDFNAVNENEVLSVMYTPYHSILTNDNDEEKPMLIVAVRVKYMNKEKDDDVIDNLSMDDIKTFIQNMNAFWARRND